MDQELGWCREEFKKIGVEYAYFRSRSENNFYPHYIHNLDNLIRFGGLYPPVAVHADIRRTRLLGAAQVYEGGCMLVRAGDGIFTMADLKGKKVGLTKSLNTIKNDWWWIQEDSGIELMLRVNGMTRDDVEIVEFPYPDDWYDKPEMLQVPMNNPSELWLRRDHKHDLAFRPLETALEKGTVDAIYTQSKVFQHLQEDTGKFKAIEDLSRYPDWTLQMANCPAVITCTDVMADEHPDLVIAYMKAMIKVGRWANEHKHAAAVILNRQTFYRDVEDTYQGIKGVDMVPNLAAEPRRGRDRQGLHAQPRLHQARLRRARMGRTAVPGEGRRRAAGGGVEADHDRQTARGVRAGAPPRPPRVTAATASRRPRTRKAAGLPGPHPGRPARRSEPDTKKVDPMSKTAMQMIGEARAQVPLVEAKEAANELDSGAVLVDVREPEEWQHGHINGSVQAPRGLLEFFADPTSPRHKDRLDPSGRVIVVCASGARASLAALTLKTMGYQDVAILDGGLKGWIKRVAPIPAEHRPPF